METIVKEYKAEGKSAPVKAEMTKLLQACISIEEMEKSENASDSLFYADIKPWVNRTSDMALLTIRLLDQIDAKAAGNQTALDKALSAKLAKAVKE